MTVPSGLETVRDLVLETTPLGWQQIVIHDEMSADAKKAAFRLNALGSLFYFSKWVLGNTRLSPRLHGYICKQLEQDSLRLVMEWPRAHFKTSLCSISAPMWWALPFSAQDEDLMFKLGYSEEWVRWMRRAHYSSTRTLIASETIQNARLQITSKIDQHYKSNDVFRFLFPTIIPKDSARWNQDSLVHNRLDGVFHGEGTYDVIGVKGALQSRHYDRVIEDDLVGEKAIASDSVMETTIEWHRKLPGAFDSDPTDANKLADQIVVGNRWSHRDLNSWIRKNETGFTFMSHSALGGCCERHPAGEPIFPEEFTLDKLATIRATEGSYNFHCQYLNNPIAPEAVRFRETWLRHYSLDVWKEPDRSHDVANWQQLNAKARAQVSSAEDLAESQGAMPTRLKIALKHDVKQGEVMEDIRAADLDRFAFLDPNHSGEHGRARNAIIVIGVYNRPPAQRRIYLLACWAKACSHDEWLEAALGTTPGRRGLVVKWRCHSLYIESEVAGQTGWRYAIKERMRRMDLDASFSLRPLKTDRTANSKDNRIVGMESIYENGFFWVPKTGCEDWIEEYTQYPNGATVDLLDLTGYIPQAWTWGGRMTTKDFMAQELKKRQAVLATIGPAGY